MNKVKRFLIGATAGAVMFGSLAFPAFAGPPEAPATGCPSAFTGDQVVPPDSGLTPNKPDSGFNPKPTDPQPDLNVMFSGVCTTPGA